MRTVDALPIVVALTLWSSSAVATAIYAVTDNGDLFFYRHAGMADGSMNWPVQGKKIGNGWNYKQLFAGDNGSIYAVADNDDLFFYRHAGMADGSINWPVQGKKIGNGWNYKQLFAGDNGSIYAVAENGDLFLVCWHGRWFHELACPRKKDRQWLEL